MEVDDVAFGRDLLHPLWMWVRVRRSKNDPLGKEGMKKWMPVPLLHAMLLGHTWKQTSKPSG